MEASEVASGSCEVLRRPDLVLGPRLAGRDRERHWVIPMEAGHRQGHAAAGQRQNTRRYVPVLLVLRADLPKLSGRVPNATSWLARRAHALESPSIRQAGARLGLVAQGGPDGRAFASDCRVVAAVARRRGDEECTLNVHRRRPSRAR